jgi:hypothetical protein
MHYTRRFSIYYQMYKQTMPLTHYMHWIERQWNAYEKEHNAAPYSLRGLVSSQDAFDDWLERKYSCTQYLSMPHAPKE